tara:strand:- start:124 stop:429 length:306 start_codon:yes stop_codon:yes gene_type:complete
MKYKNKDGIELNYKGNDSHKVLVREVVGEAIKVFENYNRFDARSAEWALSRGVNFLKDNFDLWEERSDEWRINQFNRNRSIEDQVSSIEEMERRIDEISNS